MLGLYFGMAGLLLMAIVGFVSGVQFRSDKR